jgi:hypothetical protein
LRSDFVSLDDVCNGVFADSKLSADQTVTAALLNQRQDLWRKPI